MRNNEDSIFESQFLRIQKEAHETARNHGFDNQWTNELFVPAYVGLIMTELGEAIEAHRTGNDSIVSEELADIVIRTMHLADILGVHLGAEVLRKMSLNKERPFRHGEKRY